MRTQAAVATPNARRYLGQLVKHFSHKLPFALMDDNSRGEVNFPAGLCTLQASEAALTVDLAAQTPADMAQLQEVVASHLLRFAHREEIALDWRDTTVEAGAAEPAPQQG